MDANPDYSPRLHLVREWFVEIGDDSLPWREIGLNGDGEPVLAGPDDRNHGFWLDTNTTFADFSGEPISQEEFEAVWSDFQVRGFPSAPAQDRLPSAAPFIGLMSLPYVAMLLIALVALYWLLAGGLTMIEGLVRLILG
jgi:hypothetical protein